MHPFEQPYEFAVISNILCGFHSIYHSRSIYNIITIFTTFIVTLFYSTWNNFQTLQSPLRVFQSTDEATKPAAATKPDVMMLVMEAEPEKTCCHICELEEERRVMARRLERLLRRMADDRRRTLEAAAALREERRHRLLLEPANAKLERELGDTRPVLAEVELLRRCGCGRRWRRSARCCRWPRSPTLR